MRAGRILASIGVGAITLGTVSTAHADTYYVATDGDDATGDGSSASPWATITHAINEAIPQSGGHEVVVRDGTYVGSAYLSRAFDAPVVVRAEHPYRAKLTNTTGENEVIRVYFEGSVQVTFEGFVISNAHQSYTCPNGRESYYLIHIQDASDVTLRDNVIYGNNAPGRCNELLKVNRGSDTAYPRNIVVQGNVFYDPANAGGSDMIDSVRPGELDIVDNIFLGSASHPESQSFITIKRQVQTPPADARSPRFFIARNVFLSYNGHNDQAFVQLGEDGYAEHMITDALVENNLVIGNSDNPLAAPFQLKGSQQIVVRANTVVGDLPGGAYGLRIGTEEDNPACAGFEISNNVWSDPTGTMGTRLVNAYGLVDVGSIVLDLNLYWNGGSALPTDGDVLISSDARRLEADPGLETDQSGIVEPRFDETAGTFPSGATSIREEFLRLVETYGAIPEGSPAVGAADGTSMPSADIRNLERDASPDLGAYERGATAGAGGGGVGGGWGGTPATGGTAQGASSSGGASNGGSGTGDGASEDEGGCGCRAMGSRAAGQWPALLLGVAALGRRRRRRG